MTPSRKKPGMAFWATVVVVVVLAYPLSFGPACWVANRTDLFKDDDLPVIYRPIGWLCFRSPSVERVLFGYARVGMTGTKAVNIPVEDGVFTWIEPDWHFLSPFPTFCREHRQRLLGAM
jgi:hypothetical protein